VLVYLSGSQYSSLVLAPNPRFCTGPIVQKVQNLVIAITGASPKYTLGPIMFSTYLGEAPVGEMTNLKTMVGDVSSAYLEAYTQEKVCFIAGPEFGPLQDHLLVIDRALYGLRTSGARWHDCLADVLCDMGIASAKQILTHGLMTVESIMNMSWSMWMILCASALIQNNSSSLLQRCPIST
jgi:hypothetical protein